MPPKRGTKRKVEEEEEEEEEKSVSSNENSEDSGSDNDSDNDEENDDDDDDNDNGDDNSEDGKKKGRRSSRVAATKKAPAKKAAKKVTKAASKKNGKKTTRSSDKKEKKEKSLDTEGKVARIKTLKKSERLEEARKAYKWWDAPKLPNGVNWQYLEHPGMNFPAPYQRHNIPLKYDGVEVELTAEQEEIASFYAAMPDDGPQLGNAKTRPIFQKNFFEDFKEVLGPKHTIKSFQKCDFSAITEYFNLQKNLRKVATDEEKLVKKEEKERLLTKFGYSLIDGRLEKMGNFTMEPPGLFRGRGEHPKTGRLKRRCLPESVSLNLSEDAVVPICSIPGHAWQSARHDPSVTWLCSWTENVQDANKYVMLAASSSFKGKSDMDKYTKAIKLKSCIHKVREDYTGKIRSRDRALKQLGTAMWIIDVLALRVGGEKGEDEADTVGCCSLRVEHLKFCKNENGDADNYEIELEFLGKDSMLYKQTINFATYGELGKQVYNNLESFCADKESDEDIFETLNPPVLNKHLSSLMKGLTAKVFRTYNASVTLEKELPSAEEIDGLSVQDKVLRYNAANRQVAILCNHQKTVSKAQETTLENMQEKLQAMRDQRNDLVKWLELAKKKKANQIPLKEDDADIIERIQQRLKQAIQSKEQAKTNEQKLAAATALEEAKAASKEDQKRKQLEKHKFKSVPNEDSLASRVQKWTEDIRKFEVEIRNRDENKEVALGTSKINYMDPRISVAWCKRCDVPIEKIFARTLRDKFNWAMAVPPTWKFE